MGHYPSTKHDHNGQPAQATPETATPDMETLAALQAQLDARAEKALAHLKAQAEKAQAQTLRAQERKAKAQASAVKAVQATAQAGHVTVKAGRTFWHIAFGAVVGAVKVVEALPELTTVAGKAAGKAIKAEYRKA